MLCSALRIPTRALSTSSIRFDLSTRGGHPQGSLHLRWTDPQPCQEHAWDVKLKDALRAPDQVPKGPTPDKLFKTIELEALAYEPSVLDSYEWFVVAAATHLGIPIGRRWKPDKPDHIRFNLLRSVHVHKAHQVHYEVRTHHRFINLHRLTGSTADTFLEYIERNLPEGVGLKVTKFEVTRLPEYVVLPASESNSSENSSSSNNN